MMKYDTESNWPTALAQFFVAGFALIRVGSGPIGVVRCDPRHEL
jgi:hypothetical protein